MGRAIGIKTAPIEPVNCAGHRLLKLQPLAGFSTTTILVRPVAPVGAARKVAKSSSNLWKTVVKL